MKHKKSQGHEVRKAEAHGPSAPEPRTGSFRVFDLAVEPRAPSADPAISACMIVRNESANLRPCVASLGDLASELIVVDTGSDDNTVEVALELGARVFRSPWVDDFAAARNESIRHATREWVLWLDADDRLDVAGVAQLKRAASSGLADAYMCRVRSRHDDGSMDVTEHIRLFRNGLGVRFAGPIHETVLPDLRRLGLQVARTDIVIEHTGYLSAEVTRQKSARNLAILDRVLADHPDRLELVFYRGHARHNLGDMDGAMADMQQYLARTKPSRSFDQFRFWAYADIARALEKKGDEVGLESLLLKAIAEFPNHPYLLAALGRVQLGLNKVRPALERLHAARDALQGAVCGLWPPEAWIELGIADCYRVHGEVKRAIHWAEQAVRHAPDWSDASVLLARLYADADLIPKHPRLRGLIFLSRGEHARAADCFADAIDADPFCAANYRFLAAALRGMGREQESLEAWQLAAQFQSRAAVLSPDAG